VSVNICVCCCHLVSGELTRKYVCGARRGRGGLSAVDYEDLLNQAKKHKEVGVAQWRHMKDLSQQSVCRKEVELLSIHREVWTREMQKLWRERGVVEVEVEEWRRESRLGEGSSDTDQVGGNLWVELMECEAEIASEKRHFEDVLDMVRDITVKLKNWVKAREKAESDQKEVGHRGALEGKLIHVKEEMASSWRQLAESCRSLSGQLPDVLSSHGERVWAEPGGAESMGEEGGADVSDDPPVGGWGWYCWRVGLVLLEGWWVGLVSVM